MYFLGLPRCIYAMDFSIECYQFSLVSFNEVYLSVCFTLKHNLSDILMLH